MAKSCKGAPQGAAFLDAIRDLATAGADCVILGCTEVPLIINGELPLPVLDSTRLLATDAVSEALSRQPLQCRGDWLVVRALPTG